MKTKRKVCNSKSYSLGCSFALLHVIHNHPPMNHSKTCKLMLRKLCGEVTQLQFLDSIYCVQIQVLEDQNGFSLMECCYVEY